MLRKLTDIWARVAEPDRPGDRRILFAFYILLSAIAVYPVLSVTVPPLVDYPNHLARVHILSAWHAVPDLQRIYVVDWKISPNMAMDLLLPPLARIFSVYDVGRVFIAVSMLTLVVGTIVLRKILLGRVGFLPVIVFLVLYGYALYFGLLNYLFSAGLSLLFFSAWILARNKSSIIRLLVFSLASTALLFCHFFGFLAYCLLVGGYEIWRAGHFELRGWRLVKDWAVSFGQFLLPGAFLLHWMLDADMAGTGYIDFGSPTGRLRTLMSPATFSNPLVDYPVIIFLAALLGWGLANRKVGFAPELKVAALLLGIATIAMPTVLFEVTLTDWRLPVVFVCLIIAGTRTEFARSRQAHFVIVAAIGLLIVRTATVAQTWRDIDEDFDEYRTALEAIAPGANLLLVMDKQDFPEDLSALEAGRYVNLLSLATIDRATFNPMLFTEHTTVRAAASTESIDAPIGIPVSREQLVRSATADEAPGTRGEWINRYVRLYWIGWPETFDYVVSIRFGNRANPCPDRLVRVEEGTFFDIFRVVKQTEDTDDGSIGQPQSYGLPQGGAIGRTLGYGPETGAILARR